MILIIVVIICRFNTAMVTMSIFVIGRLWTCTQPSADVETLLQLDERDVHDRMVGTVSFTVPEAVNLDKVSISHVRQC